MSAKAISYWTTTILLVASISPSGIAQMVHQPDVTAVITRLGYPLYFVVILGFWKASARIALLFPRFPRLKEWAYVSALRHHAFSYTIIERDRNLFRDDRCICFSRGVWRRSY